MNNDSGLLTKEEYLEDQLESLKAKLAMQAEALESICGDKCNAEYNPCEARTALNATQADVDAFMAKKKAEWEKETIEATNKRYFQLVERFVAMTIGVIK